MSWGSIPVQKLAGSSVSITESVYAKRPRAFDLTNVKVECRLGITGVAATQDGHGIPAAYEPFEVGGGAAFRHGREGKGCRQN